MKNRLLIYNGKLISDLIQRANLGNGSTWPGHLALKINKNFIKDLLKNSQTKIVFVVGTNGKTTTTSLITHILQSNGKRVIQNISGANLLNGIASTLLLNASTVGEINADYLLFEIDENAFPLACKELTPDVLIMLNLFRDQLDRYGEVNTIAAHWHEALKLLPMSTELILNADDPQIAYLGKRSRLNELYFGIDEKGRKKSGIDHSSDSIYCPHCGKKLTYIKKYYSHLGVWSCTNCQLVHPSKVSTVSPSYPLHGLYNKYNTNAATLTCHYLGLSDDEIKLALVSFSPSFGRQEKIKYNGKEIEVILAKNPAGFDQSLETIIENKATDLLLILNDDIADGTDVSWIWDVDIEVLIDKKMQITLSGTRAYDLALRLKYAGITDYILEPDLAAAITNAVATTKSHLSILPTYTAMLEVRKILTGKKIL